MDPKNEPDQHGGPPGRNGADPDQQSDQHDEPVGPNNRPDQIKNSPGPTPEPQAPRTVPDWSELGRGTTQSPKGVREILKTYFNDAQIDRADQYHSFFSSWKQLAGINISAHTRPRDIRNRVLIVEADHPGWVQLLHMQKRPILKKIRREFPQLDITDLRIVVGELPPQKFDENAHATDNQNPPQEEEKTATAPPESAPGSAKEENGPPPESPDQQEHKSRFEQALEKLGKSVEEREKDK